MIKRRVEIIAFERERIVRRPLSTSCPVCLLNSEMLTTRQAGALAQVRPESIYRWLAQGKAHGVRTPGGQHRICRHSLFCPTDISKTPDRTGLRNEKTYDAGELVIAGGGTL